MYDIDQLHNRGPMLESIVCRTIREMLSLDPQEKLSPRMRKEIDNWYVKPYGYLQSTSMLLV